MKWLARSIDLLLLIVYVAGALVMAACTSPLNSIPVVILATVGYALFMIVTMGSLFEQLPEPIQKYFRNKTPDNPDGCDI